MHITILYRNHLQHAPRADDNASGVAVLLEVARILKDVELTRGVCFACFGGEEQGLFGSKKCADVAKENDWNIDLVINLDKAKHSINNK